MSALNTKQTRAVQTRGAVPERTHYPIPPVKGPAPFGWLTQSATRRDRV